MGTKHIGGVPSTSSRHVLSRLHVPGPLNTRYTQCPTFPCAVFQLPSLNKSPRVGHPACVLLKCTKVRLRLLVEVSKAQGLRQAFPNGPVRIIRDATLAMRCAPSLRSTAVKLKLKKEKGPFRKTVVPRPQAFQPQGFRYRSITVKISSFAEPRSATRPPRSAVSEMTAAKPSHDPGWETSTFMHNDVVTPLF